LLKQTAIFQSIFLLLLIKDVNVYGGRKSCLCVFYNLFLQQRNIYAKKFKFLVPKRLQRHVKRVNVLFTHESPIELIPKLNRQNFRLCNNELVRNFWRTFDHRWHMTVWANILARCPIKPGCQRRCFRQQHCQCSPIPCIIAPSFAGEIWDFDAR